MPGFGTVVDDGQSTNDAGTSQMIEHCGRAWASSTPL